MHSSEKISIGSLFKASDFTGKTIVVAVSGGSDSLALLFLAHDYITAHKLDCQLVAVTVDHRLRPEAALEAQWVDKVCERYKIAHETIQWLSKKPSSALAQSARLARYDLLIKAAKKLGAHTIMTGHTLDDQVETYVMRLQRGSLRGLAVMARESRLQGSFSLVRPLLLCRRQQLRAYLNGKGLGWVNDPSNENKAYERVRVRKSLDETTVQQTARKISKARELRKKQSHSVAQLIIELSPTLNREILEIPPFSLDIDGYKELGFTFALFSAVMGGAPFLPSLKHVQQLQVLCCSAADRCERSTFSGALIEKSPKGWRIWRENRNLTTEYVDAGQTMIWDGRFQIENKSLFQVRVAPADISSIKELSKSAGLDNKGLHFPSLQASPLISQREQFDMPILDCGMRQISDVAVCRIMNPFKWLISGDDFGMVDMLSHIFWVKYPKK